MLFNCHVPLYSILISDLKQKKSEEHTKINMNKHHTKTYHELISVLIYKTKYIWYIKLNLTGKKNCYMETSSLWTFLMVFNVFYVSNVYMG